MVVGWCGCYAEDTFKDVQEYTAGRSFVGRLAVCAFHVLSAQCELWAYATIT